MKSRAPNDRKKPGRKSAPADPRCLWCKHGLTESDSREQEGFRTCLDTAACRERCVEVVDLQRLAGYRQTKPIAVSSFGSPRPPSGRVGRRRLVSYVEHEIRRNAGMEPREIAVLIVDRLMPVVEYHESQRRTKEAKRHAPREPGTDG